jgi:arsenate reductase
MKPNVLVLCTGNSCRSQMAEGFLRHYAADRFSVYSAGTERKNEIHPLAIEVMSEVGVDLLGQRPRHLKEYLGHLPVRYLIIVCSGADESCPRIFPGLVERIFWPFDDPAKFEGSPEGTLLEFRRIRDAIRDRIIAWLREIDGR